MMNTMRYTLLYIVLLTLPILTAAQTFEGSWRGAVRAWGSELPLVVNINSDGSCTVDSPEQGIYGVETAVSHNDGDSLKLTIAAIGATLAGHREGDTIRATYRILNSSFPIALAPYDNRRLRPQTPAPPYPYKIEEVTFTNDAAGATLAGTLTYPTAYKGSDSTIVVIMVTGSGQQNRDEEIFDHKPFAVIADHLARHGIASLRYDDRGYAKSGGDATTATTADFANDAAAGVALLRERGFAKVGLLGHSEGGTIGFMLGARGLLDFVISMAGTAIRGDSILLEQNRRLVGTSDITIEQVQEVIAAQRSPWLNFFATYSPVNDIRSMTCPVLALAGERDTQVDPMTNIISIQRNLPKNEQNLIIIYPGLNHLFQNCTKGTIGEYVEIEQTIAPEVLNDITTWILK